MTQQGLIPGTAGYMSPEQASGQATDQRADIRAFGVLVYEMLTGMSGAVAEWPLAGLRLGPHRAKRDLGAGLPEWRPVRVSANRGYEPQWSRDGRELFYWQGNAMTAVAVQTEDTFSFGRPESLFSGNYFALSAQGARTYDVGPDGRFLMILAGDGSTATTPLSIVVVQNFSRELRERVAPGSE